MKKLFSILFAGLLSLGLFTGCTMVETPDQTIARQDVEKANDLKDLTEEQIELAEEMLLVLEYVPLNQSQTAFTDYLSPEELEVAINNEKRDLNEKEFDSLLSFYELRLGTATLCIETNIAMNYTKDNLLNLEWTKEKVTQLYDAYYNFIIGPALSRVPSLVEDVKSDISSKINYYSSENSEGYNSLKEKVQKVIDNKNGKDNFKEEALELNEIRSEEIRQEMGLTQEEAKQLLQEEVEQPAQEQEVNTFDALGALGLYRFAADVPNYVNARQTSSVYELAASIYGEQCISSLYEDGAFAVNFDDGTYVSFKNNENGYLTYMSYAGNMLHDITMDQIENSLPGFVAEQDEYSSNIVIYTNTYTGVSGDIEIYILVNTDTNEAITFSFEWGTW